MAHKYHGKPCKRCGNTLRLVSNNQCVDCKRIDRKKWKQKNKDKVREYQRRYQQKNKERASEYVKKWQKNNPDKVRKYWKARECREHNAYKEPYNFKAICKHYGDQCLACGNTKIELTVDHIMPLAKGGTDTPDNVQPLCRSCNASKGIRIRDYRPDAGPLRWIQNILL